MRNPGNETQTGLNPTALPSCLPQEDDENPRTCILTRNPALRDRLVRLALSPDGEVLPDIRARAPGRGAWIGVDQAALRTALANGKLKGALARAFRTGDLRVPGDLAERMADQLRRAALDRLGLEAKAGHLLTGAERIEQAARGGQVRLLLHAADAGADGIARLAQAWRVGSEREGSGLKGLVLPLARPILSLALGRENVVHAAITNAGAANRVSSALTRWLNFVGPEGVAAACETSSQGASTLPAQGSADQDDERGI